MELTGLMRSDPAWSGLRRALLDAGLAPDEVLLGGFFEDEAGGEYGVILTASGRAFEFERSSLARARGFKRWREVGDVSALLDTFPAVACAMKMAGRL